MTVPDTLEGALILSGIDFLLSFVIIGGIGVALALLPRLDRFLTIDDNHLKSGH